MPEEPCYRLLQCFDCKSLDQLPDYAGPPDADQVLHYADGPHLQPEPHNRALHRVECRSWDDTTLRRAIVEQMWASTRGFKPSYYNVRDTLKEDAAHCFRAHHRSIPCLDWRDSTKLLSSPAAKERRWLAREVKRDIPISGVRRWLCDFCPVATEVARKQRDTWGDEAIGNLPRS